MNRRDRYIVPHDWPDHQRQLDRVPVWIKLYLRLLDNPKWWALRLSDQALLINIWMLYARFDGQLRVADVIRYVREPHANRTENAHRMFVTRALARLNHAGFIGFSLKRPLTLSLKDLTPVDARDGNGQEPNVCPFCEIGGGRHQADCPTLDDHHQFVDALAITTRRRTT